MPRCLTPGTEPLIERSADRLLAGRPGPGEARIRTERALAGLAARDALRARGHAPSHARAQSRRDELAFLSDLAGVPDGLGLAVRMWSDGWTFGHIGLVLGVCDRWASALVRQALARCLELEPATFRSFSTHGVYHAPSRAAIRRSAVCAACGASFVTVPGLQRHCSDACRLSQRARSSEKS